MSRMERNVRLFYLYIFFIRLDLWFAIIQLFFLERGFSLTQYTLLGSVWYLSNLIFEIPTGALTDRLGKKGSMLIALISLSVSLLILVIRGSYLLAVISYILWGFSSSFETGTYTAFLYDSLKQINREEEFRKVIGRTSALTILAAALGSISAGFLGGLDLDLPILVNALLPLLVCPLLLLFTEPEVPDRKEPSYLLHIRESVHYVSRHKLVAVLILYSSIMGAAVWGLYNFYQPFLSSFGITVERIGILYSFFRLISAAGAYLADAIYNLLGEITLYLIPFGLAASALCMGLFDAYWVSNLIFVNFFLGGFYLPIIKDLLNQHLPSGKRATIISFSAVVASILNAIIDPMLGRISDLFSIRVSFMTAGIAVLVLMSWLTIPLKRELKRAPVTG